MTDRSAPWPIITLHLFALIGVLFWLTMVIQSFADASTDAWLVLILAIILGGAHAVLSIMTSRHSARALIAIWFILIGDIALTIFADWKAIALVLFTVVLLLLARTRGATTWFAQS